MFNLSEQSLEAYADWLAHAEDDKAKSACLTHAHAANATDLDIDYITTRAQYRVLAMTYGEGYA